MQQHSNHESITPSKMIWVLLCQAAVVVPHVTHLQIWITIFCVLMATWGYLTVNKHWHYPNMLVRLMLVIFSVTAVAYSYNTIIGRDAGVALLIIMMSLKLLEMKTHRDVMLFVFLGYFIIITNFFFSQSIAMAIYMFFTSIGLTATLVMLSRHDKELHVYQNFRHAIIMVLQAIPFMLALFVLFPRLPGPLWVMPEDKNQAVSGLSDSMTPGSISNLIRSDAVAFRVKFENKAPGSAKLYWRGPVLSAYDGRTWNIGENKGKNEQGTIEYTGTKTAYTIILEPHNRNWLFALEMPSAIPPKSFINSEFTLSTHKKIHNLYQYSIESYTNYTINPLVSKTAYQQNLQIPDNYNPRTAALAETIRQKFSDKKERVKYILGQYRQQNFSYTLTPPLLGSNSIDDFLFNTRSGFCEHYAGSFVYLMRLLDIPARVVLGYQGGEFNNLGDYMIIKQSDAHAWAEIWLSGEGWVRVDPTSAVSPQRIDAGIDAALPERIATGGLSRTGVPLFRQFALYWDSLNYKWDRWILGYDADKQKGLLQKLGIDANNWQHIAISIMVTVGSIISFLALWMTLSNRQRQKDSVSRLYQKFCQRLSRIGFQRLSHEGPRDFAQRVTFQRDDLKHEVELITLFYIQLRYERNPPERLFSHFKNRVRQFRPRPA